MGRVPFNSEEQSRMHTHTWQQLADDIVPSNDGLVAVKLLCPTHTADADTTQLDSCVASTSALVTDAAIC